MESASPRKMGDNFIGPWGDLKVSPAPALLEKWGSPLLLATNLLIPTIPGKVPPVNSSQNFYFPHQRYIPP